MTTENLRRIADEMGSDENVRNALLRSFASSIRQAHSVAPDKWSVYAENNRLRLVVGQLIVCTVEDNRVWLALDGAELERSIDHRTVLDETSAWTWDTDGYPSYKKVPSENGYFEPHQAAAEVAEVVETLHFSLLENAAQTFTGLRRESKRKHDAKVLYYLEEVLDEDLPSPAFDVVEDAIMDEATGTLPQQLRDALEEFAEEADEWFEEHTFVREYYQFITNFFEPGNLEEAQWEDVQELGKYLHAFNHNPLARARALGNPNHPIEYYREAFRYLANGHAPLEERLTNVVGGDGAYSITGMGPAAIGEIAGQLFADEYLLYNGRSKEALARLGLDPERERGETFGQKFVKLSRAAEPIVDAYQEVVGARTDVPIWLEVDQFLSWYLDNYKAPVDVPTPTTTDYRVWLISPGRQAEHWEEFVAQGIVGIGWDEMGDLRELPSKADIERALLKHRDYDKSAAIDARACYEFAHEMAVGDVLFAKRGTMEIVGVGIVDSAYRFEESRDGYSNVRSVRWLRTGSWTTHPRSRPRRSWDEEKQQSDDWRTSPRILPRKTLTDVTDDGLLLSELELLLGIDLDEALGATEPLRLKEDVLDAMVQRVIRPTVKAGTSEGLGQESFIYLLVIPCVQEALSAERLGEDPVSALAEALSVHGMLGPRR